MKFKLKQPTKFMHQNLQHDQANQNQQQSKQLYQNKLQDKNEKKQQNEIKKTYKNKKIIKKRNQPSALRLDKINQTFQKIYKNSNKLFEQLNIDHQNLLKISQIDNKQKCSCNKNVKFYCLKCMEKVCKQSFPQIQLPFQISIIHHESEKVNKSSALPLKFLTNQINFHYFSSLQQQKNQSLWKQLPKADNHTYILFPHKQSKLLQEIYTRKQGDQLKIKDYQQVKIKHLIILDCTWFQTDQLLEILAKRKYNKYLRIQNYKSLYWRYNHHNDQALSSVEAIAFFMRQYQKVILKMQNQPMNQHHNQNQDKQIKKYDNLLFLYCLNLKMILKEQQKRMQRIQSKPQAAKTKQQ